MSKDTKIVIGIAGDTKSFEKSLDQAARKLERTRKSTKSAKKDVQGLGTSFSQAANNVAIFNGQLDPISGRLSAIGTGISRFGVGSIALAAGVTAAAVGATKLVVALESYEQRQNKFNALLQATSYSAKLTASDLEELAQVTARSTLGNVAETSEAINALLTFRSVQGDVFKQTIKLATDAKVVFGGNLREGVVAFGKALNDPIANLGALSRKGIQFNDTQKKMIEGFIETGDKAKAQGIIIEELNNQFGGLAGSEAPALTSELDSLSQSADNMMESLGRTDIMVGLRDMLAQITRGARVTADTVAEVHSVGAVELTRVEELEAAEKSASAELFKRAGKLAELEEKRAELFKRAGGEVDNTYDREIVLQQRLVESAEKTYSETSKRFRDFIAERKALAKKQRDDFEKGEIRALASELGTLETKNEKIKAQMDKHHVSLLSGFEDEKDKVNRVFQEKADNASVAYSNQLKLSQRTEEKQLLIFKKSGASQEDINAYIQELHDEREQANREHTEALTEAHEGRIAKLAAIDAKEEARLTAKRLREERAAKVALSNQRKRERFLGGILTGGSGAAKIQQEYEEKLQILKDYKIADQQVYQQYADALKATRDKDLEDFINTENAKTLKVQEESAKRAAERFGENVDQRFAGVENGAGGFQDFMGVNVGEFENKQAELYTAKETAIAELHALGLSADEEEMRRAAVLTEFKIRQAKLEKDAKTKATDDTWNAMSTLGASGSKKLFAINKAANIAKAVMNTYTGATNALGSLPFPYNIAAAGLITAAGFVNVRNIKNEPMPQFHDGITTVERTGSYLLQGGERVMTAKLNADLKEDLKNRKEGKSGGDTNVNLTLPDTGSYSATEQWYEDNSDRIVRHVKYAMNRP